jgi:hypothetical protein
MLLSFLAFGLVYTWMLIHRFRLEQLEERLETEGLEHALAVRRAEGAEWAAAAAGGADVGPRVEAAAGPAGAALEGPASTGSASPPVPALPSGEAGR